MGGNGVREKKVTQLMDLKSRGLFIEWQLIH